MTKTAEQTELANVEPSSTPAKLLELAVQQNLDVEKLERLMELQERWEANQAKAEFYRARAVFQEECPSIPKTKEVKNKAGEVIYRYAPLPDILKIAGPVLRKHGFSWDWDSERTEFGLKTVCTLTHEAGHQEDSGFTVPVSAGGITNKAQDEGSSNTFGRRYSFTNVTGLAPDDDDDGASAMETNHEFLINYLGIVRRFLPQILQVKECIEAGDDKAAAEIVAEFSHPVFSALWRAPTHGSIWETKERDFMKRTEFKDLVHGIRAESGWYDQPENQV